MTQQGFPQVGLPFTNMQTGVINQTWYQLLISLWNRTGGAQGNGSDDAVLFSLSQSDNIAQIFGHRNVWTSGQIFNYLGGTIATFRNTNTITPQLRSTGWFSNSASFPGNFIFSEGRILVGEAVLNNGSSVAATGSEWVEALSPFTIRLAQVASVNTTGGIGILGASRTSNSPDAGATMNQGTQGVTSVVYNDEPTSLQACYGYYGEAWKAATARAENDAQAAEFTTINLYASAASANPYSPNPNGLIESVRAATGKGTSGNAASTAISIVGTGGASAVFQNGLLIAANALSAGNRAVCMAKGHLVIWFKPDGTGGSHIRSDVDTGELGYRIVFGDGTINFQDESNTNLWTFGDTPSQITVNPYLVQAFGAGAVRTTDQSIPDSTSTDIIWSSTDYDTNSFWDGSTKFIIPSGITEVRLRTGLQFDSNATGNRTVQINKNGSGVYDFRAGLGSSASGSGAGLALNCTTGKVSVSAGDYFQVNVSQNSGGALNIQANRTWFEIEVLG